MACMVPLDENVHLCGVDTKIITHSGCRSQLLLSATRCGHRSSYIGSSVDRASVYTNKGRLFCLRGSGVYKAYWTRFKSFHIETRQYVVYLNICLLFTIIPFVPSFPLNYVILQVPPRSPALPSRSLPHSQNSSVSWRLSRSRAHKNSSRCGLL